MPCRCASCGENRPEGSRNATLSWQGRWSAYGARLAAGWPPSTSSRNSPPRAAWRNSSSGSLQDAPYFRRYVACALRRRSTSCTPQLSASTSSPATAGTAPSPHSPSSFTAKRGSLHPPTAPNNSHPVADPPATPRPQRGDECGRRTAEERTGPSPFHGETRAPLQPVQGKPTRCARQAET